MASPSANGHTLVSRRVAVLGPASSLVAAWMAPLGAGLLAGCAGPGRRAAAPTPLPADKALHVVITAMAFLDVPYRRGGNGGALANGPGGTGRESGQSPGTGLASRDVAADGFDCSGFTRHVYERSLGLVLPRTAWDQARAAELLPVSLADLQPGDLVFFNTLQRPHSHVGIFVGEGRFIHAPRTGTRVRLEEMQGAAGRYWTQRFDGARRPAAQAL